MPCYVLIHAEIFVLECSLQEIETGTNGEKIVKKLIITIFLFTFITAPAFADLTGTVYISNHNNNVSSTGYVSGDGYDSYVHVYTGVYSWAADNGTATDEGKLVPNWGFCMDLPQNPGNDWYEVRTLEQAPIHVPTYGTPIGSGKADYIRELAGRYWNDDWGTGVDKAGAEAFSYAVWEIVYEPHQTIVALYDVSTFNPNGSTTNGTYFRTNDSARVTAANTMLHSLTGETSFFDYDMRAITHDGYQDFLIKVPVPGAVLLGILGLGAAGLKLRRKEE